MWLTFLVAGAFFVAFIAVEYFGMKEREADAQRERLFRAVGADVRQDAAYGSVTSDQVVHELEHQIDEELRDISYALRAPERYGDVFHP